MTYTAMFICWGFGAIGWIIGWQQGFKSGRQTTKESYDQKWIDSADFGPNKEEGAEKHDSR